MRALALAASLLSGCGDASTEACAGSPLDALYEPATGGVPLVLASEPARWIESAEARELARRLEDRGRVAATLDARARVALQNDLWGLWSRVRSLPESHASADRIERGARTLIRRLAVRPPQARARTVEALLPEARGWRAVESEMPVLSHERLFGLRRIFHLRARGEEERALFSTLVAIDPDGSPWISDVVGEVEILRFDGDRLVEARVLELDRRALRCGGDPLRPIERVEHVPALGADGFLARFDPPAPLRELPCVRCHDDASAMSLPAPRLPVGRRHAMLLEQAASLARELR